MKTLLCLACCCLPLLRANGQMPLPLKEWPGPAAAPVVLFVSGDGGYGPFFTAVCDSLQATGMHVAGLNARTYFWNKKAPEQAARDIAGYLNSRLGANTTRQLVLAGYSFGADVLPFVINRLPAALRAKLTCVVLLSPSASTDFEIHIAEMMGANKKRSMDVVAEMNNMGPVSTLVVNGRDERDFPAARVTLKNYRFETLPGGHHYDGNAAAVSALMLRYCR